MRYLFGCLCVYALCATPLFGCSEGGAESESGGSAGTGGVGGIVPSAVIPYDRTDRSAMSPFPDDFWLAPDASTPTGYRVALSVPSGEPDVIFLYFALIKETSKLDGFSPTGGIVIKLSDAPDTASLPLTPQASLEPSAALRLFNVTPGSDTLGQRIPFQLSPISRMLEGQEIDHSLVLYPSIPLTPKGRYAMVVTTDARTEDGRRFEPSAAMAKVLGSEQPGEASEISKARGLLADGVLEVLADDQVVSPPVHASDMAVVFRISVRSTDDIPLTPLSMKEQILSAAPPSYSIESVSPGSGDVSAVVRGTWQAPNWREGEYFISRDEAGNPQTTGSLAVPFVLALPVAAETGPVPVLMFQHGGGGGAQDVVYEARLTSAEAGFAVIGFTSPLEREIGQDNDLQNTVLFQTLILERRFPDFAMQGYGDQMAFLRVIEQLGSLDRVPLPDGDGVPDLDLEAPLTYLGISAGSIAGSAFLSYAPEIKAGALVVGAHRQAEAYFNEGTFIDEFPAGLRDLLPNLTPTDFWVGLSIFQMIFDHQDAHQHAAFLYRDRLEVAGTTRKASVLFQEGVGDMLIPNNATRSLAWTFGPIPHLEPVWDPSPVLEPITGPVMGNIDPETTAAFYQFVAAGVSGIPPTPGCENEPNGHFCAQDAPAALLQRVLFLRSAVEQAVPTIVDPLPLSN